MNSRNSLFVLSDFKMRFRSSVAPTADQWTPKTFMFARSIVLSASSASSNNSYKRPAIYSEAPGCVYLGSNTMRLVIWMRCPRFFACSFQASGPPFSSVYSLVKTLQAVWV
jgi:hypothetical protein